MSTRVVITGIILIRLKSGAIKKTSLILLHGQRLIPTYLGPINLIPVISDRKWSMTTGIGVITFDPKAGEK